MPLTVPALVKQAPDLIGSFVPAELLLERATTFAPAAAPWFKQLMTRTAHAPSAGLEQRQILAQYTALLKTVAAQRPLLLILEDLHWVDASSNALLFHLSREVANDRILIVGSYRPDEVALSRGEVRHPLADIMGELKRRHGDIWLDLGELAPVEEQRFVDAYLDTEPNRLGRAFRAALFRHTRGHALFTVELLRELQERGDLHPDAEGYWIEGEAIDWQTLPAKVEGVIEQRINRLEEDLQAILTVASVEGETFTAEVVARVEQLNERGLVQQLSRELDKQHRLVTTQALDRVGQQRLSFYRFRHYLFQHYLYHSLDELERAYLHEAVGQALEVLYGEQTEPVAVQLAHHFEQAGLMEKAVRYLRQAGDQARRIAAPHEAIRFYRAALERWPAGDQGRASGNPAPLR
jgi:predicted ATPase